MQNWDVILDKYVHNLISPDGRNTFESTSFLAESLLQKMNISQESTVVDIGCGWGNITTLCASRSTHVVGIEPDASNLQEALKRSKGLSIDYIQGSFETPNYYGKADVVISSLAFHQVRYDYKQMALKNIKNMLVPTGHFILCDMIIMFDAERDAPKFNEVYRYLLAETTPPSIYKQHIEPYLNAEQVYTWDDMKEYTPKDNWFYSMSELQLWLAQCGMSVINVEELCPFFGIITAALS